jgi:hypothetical protein
VRKQLPSKHKALSSSPGTAKKKKKKRKKEEKGREGKTGKEGI